MKGFLIALICIVAFVFIGIGIFFSIYDRPIQKYEWFKNQYTSIQACQANIDKTVKRISDFTNMFGDPKTWKWNTADEYQRIATVYQGYVEQYNGLVADYNSASSKFNWKLYQGSLPVTVTEYKDK